MSEIIRIDRPFPMEFLRARELGPFYQGPIYIWDIDKTYLDTHFSQWKGLLRIPLELGVDKNAYPGVVPLLQGLRDGPRHREHRPLYFISASPHQIRPSLEKKMLLDGVEYDGLVFKRASALLWRGEFSQLRHQVAFKLAALLRLAEEVPAGARLVLFGDDAEQDALIYSLFADVVAGRLRTRQLDETLQHLDVPRRRVMALVQATAALPHRELVDRVYIHLVRDPSGGTIEPFGPRVKGYPTAAALAPELVAAGDVGPRTGEAVRAAARKSRLVPGRAPADRGWWLPENLRT